MDIVFLVVFWRLRYKLILRSARSVTQLEPEQVTTDGHTSYPNAITDELGTDVDHRTNRYKNNVIEQNHRGIKGRCRPMAGSKTLMRLIVSAAPSTRFATSCDRLPTSTRRFGSVSFQVRTTIGCSSDVVNPTASYG
jgi:hypothetical protein